ncbi:MAG: hypothetical protein R3C51_02590 [Parvularculaceae bacterium]
MAGPEDLSETGADAGIARDFGDDVRLPAAAHPSRRAGGVIARLSGMFSPFSRRHAAAEDRPQFDLQSPLKSLFALHETGNDGGEFSLGHLLQQAARQIEKGKAALSAQAHDLVDAISARKSGEISLVAHSLRLLIALAWAVFAFRLDRAVLTALAEERMVIVTMLGTMPITDAQILARVFMLLAGAGVVAAFLGSWLVMATGGAGNERLRAKSAAFGAEAADLAKAFDADLNRLRDQMERRPLSSPDAAEDLSRMHLTALEAAVFFHNIQFLTTQDSEEARLKFRGYLNANTAPPRALGLIDIAPALILFFLFGLGYGYHIWAPTPEPTGAPVTSLLKYPMAFLAVLGLALVYLGVGLALDQMRGLITGRAAGQARAEALDAVRSGFVAGNAPQIDSIIRRIEDALAVFKARLSGARAPGVTQGAAAVSRPADDDGDLPWRKAPEGPRFATQTFLSAPGSFVAEDKNTGATKFFSRTRRADTEPKQSFSSAKKPPWLND